jgi:hypothetical protein
MKLSYNLKNNRQTEKYKTKIKFNNTKKHKEFTSFRNLGLLLKRDDERNSLQESWLLQKNYTKLFPQPKVPNNLISLSFTLYVLD